MPRLTHAVRSAAGRLGLEIRRVSGEMTKHQQRAILLERLGVTLVLDAGANVGQYARHHLRDWTGYKGRIASFEPVEASYRECHSVAHNDDAWTTYRYGLSDVDDAVDIRIPEGQTGLSSIHPLTTVGERMIDGTSRVERVLLHKLDDVIDDIAKPDDRLALKLDVQGHEAAVLRGAEHTLERVVLLECEMPLVPMYEGQQTFAELLAGMSSAGFLPVGMESNYIDPRTGCAFDADVFLIRG